MAYENVELVVSSVAGKIYLSALDKDGYMSVDRKEMTEDVLRVAMEYFMTNQLKQAQFPVLKNGKVPTLLFTDNPKKAKDILGLLQGEN
ncbi:hypothetical protein KZA78_002882 [Listeria monocytogenes]|uniref:DUF7446 family protein n=1 Tax=Listeria monocytogenes TaxID=1639 RepID=UPI00077590F7|nr:hypothetical protein [Listeria monocytogenes]EAD2745280.1 hypothetical protein [Listeria monocytogenes]EHU5360334.1 hypothetical protein [Listeria monocytogenes]KXS65487.1 hypothetical protein AWJ02_00095 [Listeria monocytogenes]KXW92641.1 hypothetical protein AWJ00_06850 [Listeria monocytogenes]KXX04968.1 hypothetical protein AWI95_08785 [Listeria monocytogenes]